MSHCTKCRHTIMDGARFCPNCGGAVCPGQDQGRTVVASPEGLPEPNPTDPPWSPEMFQPGVILTRENDPPPNPVLAPVQREHTVIIADKSGSIGEPYENGVTKMVAEQRGICSMIITKARIDPADEVGLVAFDSKAEVLLPISPLSSHRRQMIELIQSLTPGGGTDINAGLKTARDLFDWSQTGIVHRIVLLTDGHGGNPLTTAEDLKQRGVVLDVIGVGAEPNLVNEKLLRKVASFIDGELHYRFIKDQKTLVDHYTRLANKTMVCG